MQMSSRKAASLCLVDVAVNLTDCVFHGVDRSGKRLHEDDFDAVLQRAEESGVRRMIITGTSLLQNEKAIALCRRYPGRGLYCTVGVHPAHSCEFASPLPDAAAIAAFVRPDDDAVADPSNDSATAPSPEEERVNAEARLAHLAKLVEDNRDVVVAVGEIGIDYAELRYSSREVQEKYFVAQLRAFASLRLPFLFHSRECGMRFVELLKAEAAVCSPTSGVPTRTDGAAAEVKPILGVVHSFNGSMAEQEALLGMGLHLSLNGSAFRARELASQVCRIPHDRLLLETDAPWCDIRPKDYGYSFVTTHFDTVKGKKPFVLGKCVARRNEPCHLVQVLEAYMGAFNAERPEATLTKEALIERLYSNYCGLFHS